MCINKLRRNGAVYVWQTGAAMEASLKALQATDICLLCPFGWLPSPLLLAVGCVCSFVYFFILLLFLKCSSSIQRRPWAWGASARKEFVLRLFVCRARLPAVKGFCLSSKSSYPPNGGRPVLAASRSRCAESHRHAVAGTRMQEW